MYFTTKFSLLGLVTDTQLNPFDAGKALRESPSLYGVLLISMYSLFSIGEPEGFFDALWGSMPIPDRSQYTVVVFGAIGDKQNESEFKSLLINCGVHLILDEPYSFEAVKEIVEIQVRKRLRHLSKA